MMERYCFSCQMLRQRVVWVVGLLLLPALAGAARAEMQYAVETPGSRSIALTHISPQLAQQMVDPLKLATVTPVPGTSNVLVTGASDPVRKVAVILELIDSAEPYEIRELRAGTSLRALPSNDQIANAIGSMVIGTFNRPPRYTSKAKAIIDVIDARSGSVWAVAPVLRMADIALALEAGPQSVAQQKVASGRITDRAMLNEALPQAMLERVRPPQGERKLNPAFDTEGRPMLAAAVPSPSLLGQAEIAALAQAAPSAQADSNTPAAGRISVTEEKRDEPNQSDANSLQPGQVVPTESGARPRTRAALMAAAANTAAASTPTADREGTPVSAADIPDPERVVDMTLPEKLPVIQLVDLVCKYMKLDSLCDPQEVTGDVALKLNGDFRGNVKVKDLYALLETTLRFKDLVMTRHKGNFVTVGKVENTLKFDPPVVEANDMEEMPGNAVVTRVFKLEHVDTTSAKNFLEGMRVTVDIKPIEETRTIVVTAYAFRMPRVAQLLSIVDKPGEPRRFHYRQLRFTTAKALADKVKALAEQLQSVSVTVGEPEPVITLQRTPTETEATYQTRLRNVQAQQAAQRAAAAAAAGRAGLAARPDQAKANVYLDADDRTNRILMIGAAKQLEMVNDLVDSLDVEQVDLRSYELYPMKHVDAQDVAKKLQELGVISKLPETANSQRITQPTTTQRTSPPTTSEEARLRAIQEQARIAAGLPSSTSSTDAGAQGPIEEPQVVVVDATNALLVNATPEQHAHIKKIISFVDSQIEEIPYKIYPLENSSPDHLAEILQSLIQETTQNKDKDGKIVDTTTVKKIQDEISIVSDPNTYSLIVYGNKKNQEWISDLIRQLDKRRPQVLIDVTLVEINSDDQFNYDLNVVQAATGLTGTSSLLGALNKNTGKNHYLEVQSNSGEGTAFYGDSHINALLTAVQSKSYGRVMAKPRLLVNDNEQGTIGTKDTTYVEVTSSSLTSQSSDVVQTASNYDPYDAGVEMAITPHISEGDLLRLEIKLKRSDFTTSTTDTTKPPNTTTSEVTTGVTLPDGNTIILGGMLKMNQTKGGNKIPLLGDIPLIGTLFRSVSNSDTQSHMYMFVKAKIIRPAAMAKEMEDLQVQSDQCREAFEEHEKAFQSEESLPGFKSRPMSPEKVLEAR